MRRFPHPASTRRPATRIAVYTVLLGAFVLFGCRGTRGPDGVESPTAPQAPGRGLEAAGTQDSFYPLQLGNEWHFDRRMVFEFVPPDSSSASGAEEFHFEEERVLDQTEELFGRTYLVESRTIVQDFPEPDVAHEWVRFRQDRSGLYEADVSITDPPGSVPKASASGEGRLHARLSAFGPAAVQHAASFRSALAELERRRLQVHGALRGEPIAAPPGGVLADEITRLRYPLHPGASFAVREGLLDAHVEALEQLVTPAGRFPAWRVRLVWATAGFDDTILVWFGRCGTLKVYLRAETTVVGLDGSVLGTMRIEDVEVVVGLDVQGRPCGVPPGRLVLD